MAAMVTRGISKGSWWRRLVFRFGSAALAGPLSPTQRLRMLNNVLRSWLLGTIAYISETTVGDSNLHDPLYVYVYICIYIYT